MTAIALPAVLTMAEARATLAQLQQAIAAEPDPVLDASGLHTLDSSAIAVLLACRRDALAQGKRLRLVSAPRKLNDLAALYGLDGLVAD